MSSWATPYILASFLVTLAIILSGCGDNCAPDNSTNQCFEDHCGEEADPAACLENSDTDPDCCAMDGDASCRNGFHPSERSGENQCHSIGAKTTCCVPDYVNLYGDTIRVLRTEPAPEPEPRWWMLAFGFVFGFSFCFSCCMGCAFDAPLKQHNRHNEKNRLWMLVIFTGIMCAILFHAVLKPNTHTAQESGLMDLMGGIGDFVGMVLGFIIFCVIMKPRLEKPLGEVGQEGTPPIVVGVASPLPEGPVVGTVIQATAVPTVVATPTVVAAPGVRPPLNTMVDTFKQQFNVEGTMVHVVAKTCEALGVSTVGLTVIEQAEQCWDKVYGFGAAPVTAVVVVQPPRAGDIESNPQMEFNNNKGS